MRILLINHYAGSINQGMEYRPYYMAREWVRLGHEVTIVAASWSHVRTQQPVCQSSVTRDEIDGIRYVWLKTPGYSNNSLRRVANIMAFVARLSLHGRCIANDTSPDVVIASSTYPLDSLPARRIARIAGARLVYEVHDLWPLSPIELGRMSPVHPFIVMMQFAENFAYQYADRVVSMLPNALSHMREHGLSPGKFIYIPNGIDLAEWSANSTGLPALHCRMIEELKAKGRFLVGYAGAFGIANALDSVVHAARLLQDTSVTVILIGSGPEKNRLQALASRLNLKNVEFLPSVPKSAVPALLGLMDTLLISLRRCSIFRFGVSPNKLMDYMMAAKPVIQAIEAGNDLVRDSGCGISVRPEDPEEIAAAAIRMMQLSLGERIEMGKRGRAYVQTHHDYRFLSMQFLAAIEGTTPSFHPSSDPTCAQRG